MEPDDPTGVTAVPDSQDRPLAPGDAAPPFTLPAIQGDVRSLTAYLAHGPVLLACHRGIW